MGFFWHLLSALRCARAPAVAYGVLGLLWGVFAAASPQIKLNVGASDGQFGLILLGTAAGLAATIWLGPRFDERMGRMSLPAAALMLAMAFLLPGFAQTQVALFLTMCVAGLASGLLDVVTNTRASELEHARARPLMNAVHGIYALCYALGAAVAGLAREIFGASPALLLPLFAVLCALSVPLMILQPLRLRQKGQGGAHIPPVLIILCASLAVVAYNAQATVENWSAVYIEATLDGSAAQAGFGPALAGLMIALGRFSGHALSRRFDALRMIEWAGGLTIVGALIAAMATGPNMAIFGFALLGLGVSVIGPMTIGVTGGLAPTPARSRAIARVAILGYLAFFVAPAAMGGIAELWGLRASFIAVAMILCAVPVLTIGLRSFAMSASRR